MTNFAKTHVGKMAARESGAGEQGGWPAAPRSLLDTAEIIDTAPLRGVITGLFAQLMTLFSGGGAARGAATRIWHIRRQLRALYRAEKFNMSVWLVRALKNDAAWQAQVREDLGGDAAMVLWEQRLETRLETREAPAAPQRPRPAHPCANVRPRKAARLKTDRRGLFRLAPLPRSQRKPQKSTPRFAPMGRSAASVFLWPAPIALTPADLRPDAAHPIDTPSRQQTLGIWQRRHAELLEWNFCLILADLEILPPP